MSKNIKVFIIYNHPGSLQNILKIFDSISDVSIIGNSLSCDDALKLPEIYDSDLLLLPIDIIEKSESNYISKIIKTIPKVVATNCYRSNGVFFFAQAERWGITDYLPELDNSEKNYKSFRLQLLTIIGSLKSKKYFGSEGKDNSSPDPQSKETVSLDIDDKVLEIKGDRLPNVIMVNIVVIASSTGGPKALEAVIPGLPKDLGVPVLLVQHMPSHATEFLCSSLKNISDINIKIAENGEELFSDTVYIAPGGKHMYIKKFKSNTGDEKKVIGLNENPPENSVRPSADVLFRSVPDVYGGNILSVIMTGMGKDGLEGVKYMKNYGCYCLSQTRETCVVYGMSRSIDEAGLADEHVDLENLANRIKHLVKKRNLIRK